MAATITFTATIGTTVETRTSGTMPYVAVSAIVDADGNGTAYSWHKTFAAAHQAVRTGYTGKRAAADGLKAVVLPVVPTKINGKLGDWTPHIDGFGDIPASAFTELVAAKSARINTKALDKRVEDAPVPAKKAAPKGKTSPFPVAPAAEAPAVKRAAADRAAMDEFKAAVKPAAEKPSAATLIAHTDEQKAKRRAARAARRAKETPEAKAARLDRRRTARAARKARKAAASA